jgi:putative endonuclease
MEAFFMNILGRNMFIVYVLKSLSSDKHYVGYTSDLEKRIQDHNSGLSKYTSRHCPWKLIYKEEYSTRSEAMKREKFFKSYEGRKWLFTNNIMAETNPNSD